MQSHTLMAGCDMGNKCVICVMLCFGDMGNKCVICVILCFGLRDRTFC